MSRIDGQRHIFLGGQRIVPWNGGRIIDRLNNDLGTAIGQAAIAIIDQIGEFRDAGKLRIRREHHIALPVQLDSPIDRIGDAGNGQRIVFNVIVIGQKRCKGDHQRGVFLTLQRIVEQPNLRENNRRIIDRGDLNIDPGRGQPAIAIADFIGKAAQAKFIKTPLKFDQPIGQQRRIAKGGIENPGDGQSVTIDIAVITQQIAGRNQHCDIFWGDKSGIIGRDRGIIDRQHIEADGRLRSQPCRIRDLIAECRWPEIVCCRRKHHIAKGIERCLTATAAADRNQRQRIAVDIKVIGQKGCCGNRHRIAFKQRKTAVIYRHRSIIDRQHIDKDGGH